MISIEPGIYVPNDEQYPEQYRGIGIRIEDILVVQQKTVECLTSLVPSDPRFWDIYIFKTQCSILKVEILRVFD